jgi:hypothetical protein
MSGVAMAIPSDWMASSKGLMTPGASFRIESRSTGLDGTSIEWRELFPGGGGGRLADSFFSPDLLKKLIISLLAF